MADSPTTARAVTIGGGGAGRVVTVNDPAPGEIADGISCGAPGRRRGASGAFAVLRAEFAVDICGERCPALVQPDAPLRDADNERVRA